MHLPSYEQVTLTDHLPLHPRPRPQLTRAAMALAALAITAATAGAASSDPVVAWRETGWRLAAEERIQTLRQVPTTLTVLDARGQPCEGVEVTWTMQAHSFGFGTAVNESAWQASTPSDPYRTHLRTLFNTVVLEHAMKWNPWEEAGPNREEVESMLRQFTADGQRLRGHTMVWQCTNFGATFPRDLQERIVGPRTPEALAEIRRRAAEHIRNIGGHFRGRVHDWDVLNETTAWTSLTSFLTPGQGNVGSPDLVEWLRIARSADPFSRLSINDYDILVGDSPEHRATYDRTIGWLLSQGAPLGGIGFQGHFHSGALVSSPADILARLDAFARYGLPLAITEFDTFGGDWGSATAEIEERQALLLEGLLTLFFSHPSADQFLMWGFWDGAHWGGSAPLFRKDWTEKPGAHVWRSLIFDRWWTRRAVAVTDGAGRADATVFSGDYLVKLRCGSQATTSRIRITRDAPTHTLVLPE